MPVHLQRRGAVYYYRRRLPVGASRTHVCLSLGTSSPRRARSLAARLDAVFVELVMLAETNFVSLDQLDAMLRDVIAQHSAKLGRVAAVAKLAPSFDVAEAQHMDRCIGWAYRLLDAQGPYAFVRDTDRAAMIADGLTEADAALVDQHLGVLQSNGAVPTPRAKLAQLLERHGAAPTGMNIASAQEVYFRGLSLALFATEHRYAGRVANASEIVATALQVDRDAKAPKPTQQPKEVTENGLAELGEKLIAIRSADKIWDDKTQRQARQIYKLLSRYMQEELNVHCASSVRQEHLAAFTDFLRTEIYKHYGKSTKDEARSIKQLRAEGAKHPHALRGIVGDTLNRHLTNLGELFAFARGRGITVNAAIDTAALRSKRGGKKRARDRRPKMALAISERVFRAPCFVGCVDWDRPYQPGAQVYHRALYFVPMILEYEGARREEACGLAVDDVYLEGPVPYLHIRNNEFRRIKNPQSDRLLPIHRELLRLGFDDYVKAVRALGHRRLFPDLHSPTTKSPVGDRFYDEFFPILTWASKIEKVDVRFVLHSIRHGFDTRLKHALIDAEVRADLMGHGGDSETTERYAEAIQLPRALEVIAKLPLLTAHLKPAPVQLLPWVQARAVAPFSRPRVR